ncbi:hypothetical protein [Streptococcus tangpeifui]|uniref:hypothetical protein n=1 Tax=Streptococcus tangpeifui TaxID=2709400 RepID=UPI0013EB7063|nr:hypothetical protein [Streptococcus sp. ZJ373]
MKVFLENPQYQLLLVGAVISLISTLIGMFAQTLFQNFLSHKGRVKLYIKSVYSQVNQKAWGFYYFDTDMVFQVPLWLEIHNTKSVRQIVRNLNLTLYLNNQKVGQTIQSTSKSNDTERYSFGDEGSYSFLIQGNEIKRFNLYFIVSKKELDSDFDEVRLSYFDTKDRYHEFKIFDVMNPWTTSRNKIDDDWRLINK